ncbi:raffinose/stachyose/melibiose transport system substrate-binding protein [Microbacterium sp. cf046]|uniref:ABC transporter substrate-binding protein n=1 Tax=Microbacterium sp. cf046 TaxID=1761803 RepID=UPI0008EC0A7B|nr:extracellular solute-binding protein [Microbacterium sp. cf046]SFR89861.1 raffinose/stachyose/melibiose transport system substrate-binding protein [Microbacterium sp. cf046]
MPNPSRIFTRRAAAALAVVLIGSTLGACASSGGRETIRFALAKPEAIPYMRDLVQEYNSSQDDVTVVLDTSGIDAVSAGFVRGDPPDIALNNYNQETARFIQRCAMSDLSDTEAAQSVREDLTPFMDQFGVCEGRTSAIPYSIMGAAVIYNKEIFEQNDLEVPTTWDELIEVCETLEAAGITPFYATFADNWTVGQGWYDYTVGGMLDTVTFFDELAAEGPNVGPDSAVSFQKDQAEPVDRMLELSQYVNDDAASRTYGDGNTAMANGEGAMYLQGPWALGEIAKAAPDLDLGMFPLPVTDDPGDLKARINMDLAAWIPVASKHQEAARAFLAYLYQPEVIQAYNESQLGFVPTKNAPPVEDERIIGLQEYIDAGDVYQGSTQLVPRAIPIMNYTQAIILGSDPQRILSNIDADYARLAFRQQ